MSAESMKEKGNAEFKNGNYEKAIEFYTYATEMDPKNHIYYTNRSMCYAQMKKWDKSLRDADKAVQIKVDWEKGHYRRGVALTNLNQPKEAFEAFQACLNIQPSNEDFKKAAEQAKRDMYKGMTAAEIDKHEANDLFKQGKISEAIKLYTSALGKTADDEKGKAVRADLHANLAACYVQLYEPKQVLDNCEKALKLQPNHVKALLRRGQAYEALEKYQKALEDFERALQLEPDIKMAVEACVRLRNALRRQEQLDKHGEKQRKK
jgi:stress-induced-phosphoprotein 1